MRILHCCLAAFYVDNYSYQENVFPKMHKLQGHDVMILASTETFLGNSRLGYIKPGVYLNEYGILVKRVPYSQILPLQIMKKLRIYQGIYETLDEFKPDVIFLHDCQFLSITEFVKYLSLNNSVRVYVDGHTDFINSGTNWVSKNLLHKIVYRWCAKAIEPFVRKFYGVLPLRVEFYRDVYQIPAEKIELLELGADHTELDLNVRDKIRTQIIKDLKLSDDDFLIITGGKIDARKNIHHLISAIEMLSRKDIKLIVFGSIVDEMKEAMEKLIKFESVIYVGWVSVQRSYELLASADLAVFPGTHSILWEQAVGLGIPAVFKSWNGIKHVDVGGNCVFIDGVNAESIKNAIEEIYLNKYLYHTMKHVAMTEGIRRFSYFEIAKRAIE